MWTEGRKSSGKCNASVVCDLYGVESGRYSAHVCCSFLVRLESRSPCCHGIFADLDSGRCKCPCCLLGEGAEGDLEVGRHIPHDRIDDLDSGRYK